MTSTKPKYLPKASLANFITLEDRTSASLLKAYIRPITHIHTHMHAYTMCSRVLKTTALEQVLSSFSVFQNHLEKSVNK